MPMRLLRKTQNEHMGEAGSIPTDIDTATVGDIARFVKKSRRFPLSIQL